MKFTELHERAKRVSQEFLSREAELVGIFQELDRTKGFLEMGASSLFDYSVRILGLSEPITCNLTAVARKARELPAFDEAVKSGELSVSKARKIVSVIAKNSEERWIELAKSAPTRTIEKEVARANPKAFEEDSVKYRAAERLQLSCGISEEVSENLKRAKDVLAQKLGRTVSTEDLLGVILTEFLERHDPVMKAERAQDKAHVKRQLMKAKENENSKSECSAKTTERRPQINKEARRVALPAQIKHQVNLRDRGQCTFSENGERCTNARHLEIHHIKPISRGGSDTVQNLTTLCSLHHKFLHEPVT